MSTSDLYILNGKSTTHLAEFRNGRGSGPQCWDYLSGKYFGRTFGWDECMKPVWDLAFDQSVQFHERVALLMTFDRTYILLSKLKAAADACDQFGQESENGRTENHWPAFASTLQRAAYMQHHHRARGVCLSCTSVNDQWLRPNPDWVENAWSIFMEKAA